MTLCLQLNLNGSKEAQDLLVHHSREMGAAVCAISEPARSHSPYQLWFHSHNGLAAIYVNNRATTRPATLEARGRHCVLIRLGEFYFLSCYISPNVDLPAFSDFLEELSTICSCVAHNNRLVICGDFNAHSVSWGSNTSNVRGDALEELASQLDWRLANRGDHPTFSSHQGTSIVDLTWTSPDLFNRVRNWSVREDLKSMSDHLYISFEVADSSSRRITPSLPRRWNFRRMDIGLFQEAIEWKCAVTPGDPEYLNRVGPNKWINDCIYDACQAAVPRLRTARVDRAHWWNDQIAHLRTEAIAARRA
ncbi:uncharacterized protein LOC112468979 [Temnothorax curvispinosus]|uniref:Uncharacterized protein LOC112468979 n=1 Tax=Temnothorax curvispinosus TaxID=300111 RepID=A0A6J1RGR5_9HYME|nr:uncharacterized protein LOC112468979 [Temnothorax curvispinosus]